MNSQKKNVATGLLISGLRLSAHDGEHFRSQIMSFVLDLYI